LRRGVVAVVVVVRGGRGADARGSVGVRRRLGTRRVDVGTSGRARRLPSLLEPTAVRQSRVLSRGLRNGNNRNANRNVPVQNFAGRRRYIARSDVNMELSQVANETTVSRRIGFDYGNVPPLEDKEVASRNSIGEKVPPLDPIAATPNTTGTCIT